MRKRPVPKPWRQVGLTILPGLVFLSGQLLPGSTSLEVAIGYLLLAIVVLLTVASIALSVHRRNPLQIPVWGFIPLGMLAFIPTGAIGGVVLTQSGALSFLLALAMGFIVSAVLLLAILPSRRVKRSLPFLGGVLGLTLVIAALPAVSGGFESRTRLTLYAQFYWLVVAGLLLARHSGRYAVLFVLAGGFPLMSFQIEQVIYFWDHPYWGTLFNYAETALFLIVAPVWVLRSRSAVRQVAGLLVPIAAYFGTIVFALGDVRGFSFWSSFSIAEPALFLAAALMVAAALYTWLGSQGFIAGEAPRHGPA